MHGCKCITDCGWNYDADSDDSIDGGQFVTGGESHRCLPGLGGKSGKFEGEKEGCRLSKHGKFHAQTPRYLRYGGGLSSLSYLFLSMLLSSSLFLSLPISFLSIPLYSSL